MNTLQNTAPALRLLFVESRTGGPVSKTFLALLSTHLANPDEADAVFHRAFASGEAPVVAWSIDGAAVEARLVREEKAREITAGFLPVPTLLVLDAPELAGTALLTGAFENSMAVLTLKDSLRAAHLAALDRPQPEWAAGLAPDRSGAALALGDELEARQAARMLESTLAGLTRRLDAVRALFALGHAV